MRKTLKHWKTWNRCQHWKTWNRCRGPKI